MDSSQTSQTLSFSQAIAATQSLMAEIVEDKLSEAEIQQQVATILTTKNGGRGFFVSYLTSDLSLADNPSSGIIQGLKASAAVSHELLVKNLAMSSAMVIIHQRNNDAESIAGSVKVRQRTSHAIELIDSPSLVEELQKLQTTIDNEAGEYQDFLTRWGYDGEQKAAISQAIVAVNHS